MATIKDPTLPAGLDDPIDITPIYSRPTDWLTLPMLNIGEQEVVILAAVFDTDSNFTALQISGNYSVNWGDGTIENYNSGTISYHNYIYANVPAPVT